MFKKNSLHRSVLHASSLLAQPAERRHSAPKQSQNQRLYLWKRRRPQQKSDIIRVLLVKNATFIVQGGRFASVSHWLDLDLHLANTRMQ